MAIITFRTYLKVVVLKNKFIIGHISSALRNNGHMVKIFDFTIVLVLDSFS